MKYELCIACDHCDPADTNERQQIRCTKIESYVDRFNGCDEFENKALDECFKNIGKSELTDNEIKNALECLTGEPKLCKGCHYNNTERYPFCRENCAKDALDLINRQQAEIETLTARIGIYKTCNARKDEAIHNLESEIARLKNILLRFMDEVAKWEEKHGLDVSELPLIPICDEGRSIINHHRAEAIKEFAERLTTKIVNTPFVVNCTGETDSYKEGCLHGLVTKQNVVVDMIDNLVKEMVGDE